MCERCKRISKQMSEWPSTYVWILGYSELHCRGKENEESLDGEEDSLTSEKKERQRQRERYITSQNYKMDPWTDRQTDIYDLL